MYYSRAFKCVLLVRQFEVIEEMCWLTSVCASKCGNGIWLLVDVI